MASDLFLKDLMIAMSQLKSVRTQAGSHFVIRTEYLEQRNRVGKERSDQRMNKNKCRSCSLIKDPINKVAHQCWCV
jgi:hypothetical protein